jgi:hypothetical protein
MSLEGGSAEEGGSGEFGRAGPAWDVEGRPGMGFGGGIVGVVIAECLLDAVAGVVLLVACRALPIKEKALTANGTLDIGGVIGQLA